MTASQIAALLRDACDAWTVDEREVARRVGVDLEAARRALAGDADASEIAAVANALGGTLDDVLAQRRFWEAPAAAFRNPPTRVESAVIRDALLRVASVARDRASLVALLALPEEGLSASLAPVQLVEPVPRQAEELATRAREVIGNGREPIASVRAAMRRLGVPTFLTSFGTPVVDGFSWRSGRERAAAANSNARGGKVTALRMTLAHELCHVLFDGTLRQPFGVVEQRTDLADGLEQRANAFAAYFLAPRESVVVFLRERGLLTDAKPSASDLRALSQHFIVGVEAMAWHLVNCHLWEPADVQRHRHLATMDPRGEDNVELFPTAAEELVPLERRGELLDLATVALERGVITLGRWREILGLTIHDDYRQVLTERQVERDFEHRSVV